jgi:tight adherence protein C
VDLSSILQQGGLLWSPVTFAGLVALAAVFVWMAFRPAPPRQDVAERLNDYLDRGDIIVEEDLRQPFFRRAIWPPVRGVLHMLARLLPNRNLEATRRKLQQAGNPGGISALDFYGLRVLTILALGGLFFLITPTGQPFLIAGRNALIGAVIGFLLPMQWLNSRVRGRKNKIVRALPDALDMLTIAVEAGLAFESAMVRVGEKWDNALTREFRRAIAEMRVGMSREEALVRMADRCGVPELTTFVAVLVQSTQLGVSIAQVLHTQAMEMRMKRRQRAEELARQAGVKMVIPLALFILPAMFVVVLGPIIPSFTEVLGSLTGNGTASGLP